MRDDRKRRYAFIRSYGRSPDRRTSAFGSNPPAAPVVPRVRWLVPDQHPAKQAWDWLIIVLATWTTFQVPVTMAFSLLLPGGAGLGAAVEALIDVVLIADIALQFRTTYRDGTGREVRDPRHIARRYLRGRFVPDALGSLPLQLAAVPVAGLSREAVAGLLQAPALLRTARLLRNDRLDGSETLSSAPARVARVLFLLLVAAHWVGMLLLLVAAVEERAEPGCSWAAGLIDQGAADLYVASLHFALVTMTTVGFGDLAHRTTPERLVGVPVFLISVLLQALVIGSVTTALDAVQRQDRELRSRLDRLHTFGKVHELPPGHRARLRRYVRTHWRYTQGLDAASEPLLDLLPRAARAAVHKHLHRHVLGNIDELGGGGSRFVEAVALALETRICLDGDWVVRQGDPSRDLYFLQKGCVEVIDDESRQGPVALLVPHGPRPFFGEIALLLAKPRTASVRADGEVLLAMLRQPDYEEVLKLFPQFLTRMRHAAEHRLRRDLERWGEESSTTGPQDASTRHDVLAALPPARPKALRRHRTAPVIQRVVRSRSADRIPTHNAMLDSLKTIEQ